MFTMSLVGFENGALYRSGVGIEDSMKKVTILEIAKEMRLSRNTVAKALNGGDVSLETKIAVAKKARNMGYMKMKPELLKEVENITSCFRGGTILVLFNRADRTDSIFWNKILIGISDECNQNGFRMQLHIVDERDLKGVETRKLIAEDVCGIICLCVFPLDFVKEISRSKIPLIFLDAPYNAVDFMSYGDVVMIESWYSVYEMVQHVIKKGKTKFSFIGYENGTRTVHDRYGGFISALQMNGIPIDKRLLFTNKVEDDYYNYQVIEQLIEKLPVLPEVFVCSNDDIARYVATALRKIDEKLASEATLIGFDDTIEDNFFKKGIITADINKEGIGKRLVRALMSRLQYPEADYEMIAVATHPMYK